MLTIFEYDQTRNLKQQKQPPHSNRPKLLSQHRTHNPICFHLFRNAVAAGKMVVLKEYRKEKLSNLLTKSVPGHRRKYPR